MPAHVVIPIASPGPLAGVIGISGFLAVVAWIGWRFGPTLARLAGWGWWWAAWACGMEGGYLYCVGFLLLGTLAWGLGTLWYARRHGHWPSALSARLLGRLLSERNPSADAELPTVHLLPGRRR